MVRRYAAPPPKGKWSGYRVGPPLPWCGVWGPLPPVWGFDAHTRTRQARLHIIQRISTTVGERTGGDCINKESVKSYNHTS